MRVIDYSLSLQASLFSHLFSLHISGCPCSPPGSAPETRAGRRAPGWSPPCPPAVGAGGGSPGPWWICQRSSGCSWWGFPQPPARTAWSAPLHFWLATDLQNVISLFGFILVKSKDWSFSHFTAKSNLTSASRLNCVIGVYNSIEELIPNNKCNKVWTVCLFFFLYTWR